MVSVWHCCPIRPGSRALGSNRAYAAVWFAEQHVQIAKGLGGLPARPPAMTREATQNQWSSADRTTTLPYQIRLCLSLVRITKAEGVTKLSKHELHDS